MSSSCSEPESGYGPGSVDQLPTHPTLGECSSHSFCNSGLAPAGNDTSKFMAEPSLTGPGTTHTRDSLVPIPMIGTARRAGRTQASLQGMASPLARVDGMMESSTGSNRPRRVGCSSNCSMEPWCLGPRFETAGAVMGECRDAFIGQFQAFSPQIPMFVQSPFFSCALLLNSTMQ